MIYSQYIQKKHSKGEIELDPFVARVDPQRVTRGEHHTAIDDQQPTIRLDDEAVHADLAKTADRYEPQVNLVSPPSAAAAPGLGA